MSKRVLQPLVRQLERLRGRKIVACCCNPEGAGLCFSEIRPVFEVLRELRASAGIDLLLHTDGGQIALASRVGQLIRQACGGYHVLVPWKARSAGTLIAIGAKRIVMTSLAELSPIDANVFVAAAKGVDPRLVPAGDIKALGAMSTQWFGRACGDSDALLSGLLQSFSAAALGSIFNSDRYVRTVAREMIGFHLPQATARRRHAVVEALISRYSNHGHSVGRIQARRLGLRVVDAAKLEEAAMVDLLNACLRRLAECPGSDGILLTSEACWCWQSRKTGGQVVTPEASLLNSVFVGWERIW